MTSPPIRAKDFEIGYETGGEYFRAFVGHDLVVFNLHGDLEKTYWEGEGPGPWSRTIALTAASLNKMDLRHAGVFAINCDLSDESPMKEALIEAQPSFIISGAGENYGGVNFPMGADILLFFFIRSWQGKNTPEQAFKQAKRLTKIFSPRFTKQQRLAVEDTLSFTLCRRNHG